MCLFQFYNNELLKESKLTQYTHSKTHINLQSFSVEETDVQGGHYDISY